MKTLGKCCQNPCEIPVKIPSELDPQGPLPAPAAECCFAAWPAVPGAAPPATVPKRN